MHTELERQAIDEPRNATGVARSNVVNSMEPARSPSPQRAHAVRQAIEMCVYNLRLQSIENGCDPPEHSAVFAELFPKIVHRYASFVGPPFQRCVHTVEHRYQVWLAAVTKCSKQVDSEPLCATDSQARQNMYNFRGVHNQVVYPSRVDWAGATTVINSSLIAHT